MINLIFANKGRDYYISIYNMLGQKVDQVKSRNERETIDVSNYGTGMYIINIEFDNQIASKKLIFQK